MLLASRLSIYMVQLWAKLDVCSVAGVGLAVAIVMVVISPCVLMLDLMHTLALFCGPGLLACGSALDYGSPCGCVDVGDITLSTVKARRLRKKIFRLIYFASDRWVWLFGQR